MVTTRRAKLLSEARLPYLTDRERRILARFLDRLEAHAGDRVQHVIFRPHRTLSGGARL